ncbi:MAG: hypothetical protein ACN6P1_04330 [Pseudomonas sp.]|uniref:hypothetical protein n=1 Tax=Pseudomonas sp. TaxID=306 RepID=UPI003D0D29FA
MKTSLTTGVWGSFTAPRSRALGGKSGITRATPLVLILNSRPLHFADSIPLLFLALLSAFLCYAKLPPYGQPQIPPYIQEQPCLIDQQDPFKPPDNWIESPECEPLT